MAGVVGGLLLAFFSSLQAWNFDALMAFIPLCVSLALVLSAIIHTITPKLRRSSTDMAWRCSNSASQRLMEDEGIGIDCEDRKDIKLEEEGQTS
jgi:hypothetical protein